MTVRIADAPAVESRLMDAFTKLGYADTDSRVLTSMSIIQDQAQQALDSLTATPKNDNLRASCRGIMRMAMATRDVITERHERRERRKHES